MRAVTHTKLNPRQLPSNIDVLNFVLSRTSRTSHPRLKKSDVLSQLYKSLVGTEEQPGSWLWGQCSPGSRKYVTKQFEILERDYHEIKIRHKQNVKWRKKGQELFDVFTEPIEGEFVDYEFYKNQKSGKKDQIISDDLTEEFVEMTNEANN